MRKLAALAILLLALILAVQLVLVPLLPKGAETEEAARRYEAIAARRDSLRQALAALPPAPADPGRVAQPTDALALADLQGRIAAWAAEAGVVVATAEPLPAEEGGDPTRLQLSLDLTGPLAGLQALLYRLESGRPVLTVTRLELNARQDHSLSAHLVIAAWRSES